MRLNDWPRIIQDWLYPPTCLLCGDEGTGGLDLCRGCLDALPRNTSACPRCAIPLPDTHPPRLLCGRCQRSPPLVEQSLIPFRYEEPIRHLIHALKFRHTLAAARLLGQLFVGTMAEKLAVDKPQLLIPVPLHRARFRQRGFNQAGEIARIIAHQLEVSLDFTSCVRQRHTPPQVGLSADERRRNLRGAFWLTRKPPARHIALFDDVVTTGSTVGELAKLLRTAGVERVDVWALARASEGK